MSPLKANPKRQAIASLRGYSYQIWQSLFRWSELLPDEELFLEGAEDFDLVGPERTETVQVKDTSASVTLRSPSITSCINNFWQHRESNPKTVIFFRLLTTAPRGIEQGRPFGDESGLDFWDRAKSAGVLIDPLREFLLSLPGVSDSVKAFLAQATPEELRLEFLSRFEWDTGNESQSFVEEIVDRKVIDFGEKVFNLPPAESQRVTAHLLAHVWNTVLRKEERVLRRSDFSQVFQNATMKLVPKLEFEKLQQLAALASTRSLISVAPSESSAVIEVFSAPNLAKFVNRLNLENTARTQLNSTGILVLNGMTGMGKSILASQVITGLEGDWVSVNFRGLTGQDIAGRLDLIARNLEDFTSQRDFLFDDLNFDNRTDLYEKKIEKTIFLLRLRKARVIFTSQNRMSQSIIANCDIRPNSFLNVPLMEFDEIKELAILHGASRAIAEKWKTLIAAQTGGHPALVHARILGMQFRNWSSPPASELFRSEDVDEVRQEFRKTLRQILTDDARALLYRLSVFYNRFNRRQALELANREPQVPLAGEVFDRLIGPWIEPDGQNYFRLSPLLSDAAEKIFSEGDLKDLHSAAASSYLKEKTIRPQDANSILMHGIRGKNPFPMMALVPKLLGVEPEHKDSVYELLSWLPLMNVGSGQSFFKGFKFANVMLRQLQFTIQSHLHPEKVSSIIERWQCELSESDGPADIPGASLSYRLTFLIDLLIHTSAKLKPEDVATYLIELNVLLRREHKFAPTCAGYDESFWDAFKGLDQISNFVAASVMRFKNEEDGIPRLFTSLQRGEAADTHEIWQTLEMDVQLTTLAVDRLWLDEASKETPDWPECLSKLDVISEVGIATVTRTLAAAALRAKSIVYEEYVKEPETAIEMLRQAEVKIGQSHPLIDEYKARLLLFRKKYSEALVVLEGVIKQTNGFPPGRYVVYRDAEMCAASLGNWETAAEYASGGKAAVLQFCKNDLPTPIIDEATIVFAMTFQADRAYCLWKADEKETALREFVSILEQFEKLTSLKTDTRALMLYRRVGYAIGWLVRGEKLSAEATYAPEAGWFSDFTLHEDAANFPIPPLQSLWVLLAELQIKSRLGTQIVDDLLRKASPPDIIAVLRLLKFKAELSYGDPSELPDILFDLIETATDKSVVAPTNQAGFLIEMATPLLVRLIADSPFLPELLTWKNKLHERKMLSPAVVEWLNQIQIVSSFGMYDLGKCIKNVNEPSSKRLLAALKLTATQAVDPETRFYANALVISNPNLLLWKDVLGETIENWVVDGWKEIVDNQRFALLTPQSTVPEIISACEDSTRSGFSKAASTLLSANRAVRLRLGQSLLNDLQNLASARTDY